jgi:hypothetical protein
LGDSLSRTTQLEEGSLQHHNLQIIHYFISQHQDLPKTPQANSLKSPPGVKEDWLCPIGLGLIRHPVSVSFTDETGKRQNINYEIENFVQWYGSRPLQDQFLCMRTRQSLLDVQDLRVEHNLELEDEIASFVERYQQFLSPTHASLGFATAPQLKDLDTAPSL